MTIEELRKMREDSRKEMDRRVTDGNTIEIIVGMGTCGIAAGGKATLQAFVDALSANGLSDVTLRQTGCMGLCYVEPTVEVKMPGMPDTIYGKVDAATAGQIVKNHIIEKRLLDGHVYDRPAKDILAK
jgi:NADP-reducing hydrogenase subunit HndB